MNYSVFLHTYIQRLYHIYFVSRTLTVIYLPRLGFSTLWRCILIFDIIFIGLNVLDQHTFLFRSDNLMDFIKISKNSLSLLNGRSVNQNNVKHERIWLLFNVILYISQPIREIFLYFLENGLMVHRWTILPWSVHSLLSRWGTQIMAAVLTFSIHIYGQLLESVDCYIPKHNKDREIFC